MVFFGFWGVLVVPLFVTLQTAGLAGLEHGNNTWKHLLALPLPRSMHYLVKLTTAFGLLLCAYLFLLALVALAGWTLMVVAPRTALAGSPTLGGLLVPAACSFAASLLLLALQTWIALHWHAFNLAVAVGVVGTIAGLVIGQFKYGRYFPWSMPGQAFMGNGQNAVFTAWLGIIGAVVVGAAGLYDFAHRDSI